MLVSQTHETELLSSLFLHLFEDAPYERFLKALRARTKADQCILFQFNRASRDWTTLDTISGIPTDETMASMPTPKFGDLRTGRVYTEKEFMTGARRSGRCVRIATPGGLDFALVIWKVTGTFHAQDSSVLARLSPFLATAAEARHRHEFDRCRQAIERDLGDGLGLGWYLLDRERRILQQSTAAHDQFDRERTLYQASDGKLRSSLAAIETMLDAVVSTSQPALPRAGWISAEPPTQLIAMPPPRYLPHGSQEAHILVVVRMMDTRPMNVGVLVDIFGLTRSEAMLSAKIADGYSIAEAADEMGLSIETARNYSKRIFSKTRARGQAELVGMLHRGVTAFS